MAGVYPDNPSRRLVWDEDALVMTAKHHPWGYGAAVGTPPTGDNPYTLLSQANIDDVADEDGATSFFTSGTNFGQWVTIIFPEKQDIDAGYVIMWTDADRTAWVAFSTDTTNGRDGSWADTNIANVDMTENIDNYRQSIDSTVAAMTGVVSLMLYGGADDTIRWHSAHFYGTVTAGETPDRMLFLDPDDSDNEFSKPLDWGDVERGNTFTDTFKLKNNSSGLDAANVQMTAQSLYLDADTWLTYSDDDVDYSATLDIGTVLAGGEQLIYVKNEIPGDEPMGPYVARTRVTASSWS